MASLGEIQRLFGLWQAALRDERSARIVADAVISSTSDMAVIAVVRERMASFRRLTREACERFEAAEREDAAHGGLRVRSEVV